MDSVPDFPDFYRATNGGRAPFPWQARLARMVENEGWPSEIGIPTGLGKTACIDVAVWALARQHGNDPTLRTAPTRIWYVVNRRLLVDAGYDHGMRLAALLADPSILKEEGGSKEDVEILRSTAEALSLLGGKSSPVPLQVTRLRGGAELGARPFHAAQPSIIFSTVPMFASRWMFRGYGVSSNMAPVDAALAGIDSLVLLDEAHLARALVGVAGPLSSCDFGPPDSVLNGSRSRPCMVTMTATGEADSPFGLDENDLDHPVVQRRLAARKPIALIPTKQRRLVAAMVGALGDRVEGRDPLSAVVFVNSPGTARSVFRALKASPIGKLADLELLTGRVRQREGDLVRTRLLDASAGAPAGRDSTGKRERHLFVIATQTLEVGADLDFDVLITEACGSRALIQRLGRLNRLGERDLSEGAFVFADDAKAFGVYGREPLEVWSRLRAAADRGTVELAPQNAKDVLGAPTDTPVPAGALLPEHLWEWAKTTSPPPGEAPPELFFSGFEQDSARVSVAWRTLVPLTGEVLVPSLTGAETVDIPIGEVREATHLFPDGAARLASDKASIEFPVALNELRPGDQVILHTSSGGYDAYGWDPQADGPVLDLSLLVPPGLPLADPVFKNLLAESDDLEGVLRLSGKLAQPPDIDEEFDRQALTGELVEHLERAGKGPLLLDEEWDRLIEAIRPEIVYPVDSAPRLVVVRPARSAHQMQMRSDVLDELSCSATSPSVGEHVGSVGEVAGLIAAAVGLPPVLVKTVVMAGNLHDLGKCDTRFQRWLDPLSKSTTPIAKSDRPWQHWSRDLVASGWPRGGRHEELSRRLAEQWLAEVRPKVDYDLLMHLVVAHHGHGRPMLGAVTDPSPVEVIAAVDGVELRASGDLSVADWDQPARFRRCCCAYGLWGLALLESVVRQADHEVSRIVVA